MLIYSDYFMLPRLVQICSKYIKDYVTPRNVLCVFLIAQAHNANDLALFCIDFICLHEKQILPSKEWSMFKKLTDKQMFQDVMHAITNYKQHFFV